MIELVTNHQGRTLDRRLEKGGQVTAKTAKQSASDKDVLLDRKSILSCLWALQ